MALAPDATNYGALRMRPSVSLFAVLVFAAPACSMAMTGLPSSHEQGQPPKCDDRSAAPEGDLLATLLVAGLGLYWGVAAAAADCGDDPDGPCRSFQPAVGVVTALAAIGLLSSSAHGYEVRSSCRRAKRDYREWAAAGKPGTMVEFQEKKERKGLAECQKWRQQLTDATTSAQKRKLIRSKPKSCPY